MKTITIQIGNSDDKLTQKQWHRFIENIHDAVRIYCSEVHFFGASPGTEPWQNAAWVVVCRDQFSERELREEVKTQREAHQQDSVAWTEGDTELI